MAESLSAYFHSLGVTGSEPLQQESSPPPLQEDSDDDVPDLLEAESDSDSEGVPELVADLSGVSNYDDMPELVSDDDEPPPLVGEDSDDEVNDDDTPPPLVDEDSDEEDDLPELESVPFDAQRGLPRQSYGLGKSTIGNLEGFSARGVAWEESGIGATSLSVQYQSEAWKGLILTDTAGQSAPAEPLRSPVDCPRLGDQGLVKGEERLVLGPRGAKQADPQEWSTGLFDCCSDVPTCKANVDAMLLVSLNGTAKLLGLI